MRIRQKQLIFSFCLWSQYGVDGSHWNWRNPWMLRLPYKNQILRMPRELLNLCK